MADTFPNPENTNSGLPSEVHESASGFSNPVGETAEVKTTTTSRAVVHGGEMVDLQGQDDFVIIDNFGEEYHAGRIDSPNNVKDRVHLRNMFVVAHSDSSFYAKNLCAKRFRRNYGDAVEKDPLLFKSGSTEWQRKAFNRWKYAVRCCATQRM